MYTIALAFGLRRLKCSIMADLRRHTNVRDFSHSKGVVMTKTKIDFFAAIETMKRMSVLSNTSVIV